MFFLSDNEWAKAHQHRQLYEVHFWGRIDLRKNAAEEFAALRAAGYPIVVPDIAGEIASGRYAASAVRWRVIRT
jgi:hypothetical protein